MFFPQGILDQRSHSSRPIGVPNKSSILFSQEVVRDSGKPSFVSETSRKFLAAEKVSEKMFFSSNFRRPVSCHNDERNDDFRGLKRSDDFRGLKGYEPHGERSSRNLWTKDQVKHYINHITFRSKSSAR